MHKPINPCAPDCPRRNATCHFKGACEEWDAYSVAKAEYEAARWEALQKQDVRADYVRSRSGQSKR